MERLKSHCTGNRFARAFKKGWVVSPSLLQPMLQHSDQLEAPKGTEIRSQPVVRLRVLSSLIVLLQCAQQVAL
jgi:hypothetical protein